VRNPAPPPAVILAAGRGSRLAAGGADGAAKLLQPVAGQPLFERTFGALERAGCREIVVVTGWRAAEVEHAVTTGYSGSARLTFVTNPRFDLANGVSALSAWSLVGERFVLAMGDHLFEADLVARAVGHFPPEGGVSVFVDGDIHGVFDLDDAMKVQAAEHRIVAIGKDLKQFNCIDTGLFAATPGLMAALDAVQRRRGDAALADGIRELATQGLAEAVEVAGACWQDIDTPAMLAYAESLFRD